VAATRRRFTEMANLLPVFNRFWREADIAGLRRECDRWYEPALAFYRGKTAEAIGDALEYLRMGPAAEYCPDPVRRFDECLVRTLDFTVRMGSRTPEQKEKLEAAMESLAERGYVLTVPMRKSLNAYEATGRTFAQWFPRLLADLQAAAGIAG